MGGEREEVVSVTQDKTGQANDIRFHESGGEVHFHDDKQHLKAAVPVAEWAKAWRELKHMRGEEFRYVDRKNSTVLIVDFAFEEADDPEQRLAEATIDLVKIDQFGPVFDALNRFSEARS